MIKNFNYKCSICAQEYKDENTLYTCPIDGGNLDIQLDYAYIQRKYSPGSIHTDEVCEGFT